MAIATDTIVAIATPLGVGGVGIVRLSGPDAYELARNCFSFPQTVQPRYMYYGKIYKSNNELLDFGCVVYFQEGASYTGEHVVEFHLHASPYILKQLVSELIQLGARQSTGGEFTKQAFVNGKLDLTQAESVIDLIHSNTENAHCVALNKVEGRLYRFVNSIQKQLMLVLEQIEGSIDFPDEVPEVDRVKLRETLSQIDRQLSELLIKKDFGRYVTHGVNVVIVGLPNAGKSSLLNTILGENRAIVTDIPGTTRDYIQGSVELGGLVFHFVDTAGIRKSEDYVEQLGIEHIQRLVMDADLVIWMVDQSEPLHKDHQQIQRLLMHVKHRYLLINKTDLPSKMESEFLDQFRGPKFFASLTNHTGVDELKSALIDDFAMKHHIKQDDFVCNIRQISLIEQLSTMNQSLLNRMDQIDNDDLMAIDLKQMVAIITDLTGDSLTETVLDGIFDRFCVGK